MGQLLYCSAAHAGAGRERLWWCLHPLCVAQQYHLASMAAWLSSTSISHHSLLPHICLVCLSAVNSSPHHGIAPQSLTPTSSFCAFQGTCVPIQGTYSRGKDCLFSFHLGCHRSVVSLSAFNVSPLTQTIAPVWGSDPCFSSPTAEGRSSPVFPP